MTRRRYRPSRPRRAVWFALGMLLPGILGLFGALAAPARLGSSGCAAGSGLSIGTDQPNATAPSTVSFTISDPRGPPDWVNWSFGDGLTVNRTGNGWLSITHLYETPGTFSASVVLGQGTTDLGCSTTVHVSAAPLSVSIRASPGEGRAPVTVQFTAEIIGGTSTYQSAVWRFGDGQQGTGFNVSYTYTNPGQYTASLQVVDSANQSAVANTTVRVDPSDGAPAPGPGDSGLPVWAEWLAVGSVALLVIGLLVRWQLGRPHRRHEPPVGLTAEMAGPIGPSQDPPPPIPSGIEPFPVPPSLPIGDRPTSLPTPLTPVPSRAEVATDTGPAVAASPARPRTAPAGPGRLKLSQRVMLHLYRQGHLADGEVAPIGFTQGGMSEQLQVAQSPLSSVLRRLAVAGLVVQDTRHVRGQPRRLRVYRLSPLGESVARDLYLHPPAESSEDADPAEE